MALPKEPRQKMINLMYLVLTALLALNVSNEILNAFKTVNQSLTNASTTIDSKTSTLMASLQQKAGRPETKEKAEIWLKKANDAVNYANAMDSYLKGLKTALLNASDYNPKDSSYREDFLEAPTRLFIEEKRGDSLKQSLGKFKSDLLSIDPSISAEFQNTLPIDTSMPITQNKNNKDWSTAYFHMTPTIAAITILSKFQNDVKNSEAQVVEFCHKKVGEVEVRFDQLAPMASLSSNYVMPGQEIEVVAGLGAFSSAKKPTISISTGGGGQPGPDGLVHAKFKADGSGAKTVTVNVSYVDQDNKSQTKPLTLPYFVGSPTGVNISADKVKVLYIGLDNPISVTGGSKGADAIQSATMDNGQLKKDPQGNGRFIANPANPGKSTIKIVLDGKTSTSDFMVKYVPLPVPMVGTKGGGKMPVNEFKAQQGVRADLKDFIFEGVKYTVSSFTIVCTGKNFEASGPKFAINSGAYFSSEARAIIDLCRAGSSVIITDITVDATGGQRKLDGVAAFNLTP